MTRTILIAAACTVALAGCESMYGAKGFGGTPPPDPKNPKVWVITKAGCEKPYIIVSPEPIYIYKDSGAATITWHLQTNGYSFTAPAHLAPVPGHPAPQGEIDCPSASGKNMICIDKAQNSGSWKYTIQIKADSDGACAGINPPVLDPTISNE